MAGSNPENYQAGLLPADSTVDGHRVVQLRLQPSVGRPDGFGTLMQSIRAQRYLGRRVRFAATARGHEIDGWAGLWMRVDTPLGMGAFDNMQDRALRGSTGWMETAVVLDVAEQATSMHFGVLLAGSGAVDLAAPRFEEVSADVPVTGPALADEPQALDFGAAG